MDDDFEMAEHLVLGVMAMIAAYERIAKLLLTLPLPISLPAWTVGGADSKVQVGAIDKVQRLVWEMPLSEELAQLLKEAVIEWLTLHDLNILLLHREEELSHDRPMIVHAIIRASERITQAEVLAGLRMIEE
ncbi:hypothetical protein [Nonomuraea soli]|uniref:Uncharacterized protein n=1 Tax=Nonomuraea soli TaxID=1032476 RepID=A0A7W0CV15_9ACTN|nr:hypothetical protein [Nonomuraea soli]MBA2897765.1 hypothetical protein [Nonomuraea soli]